MISEANGEGGNDQDINLGMSEDPKEVHPERRRAAGLGVEEMRAEKRSSSSMICAAVSGG
jgi:hypothetical protein